MLHFLRLLNFLLGRRRSFYPSRCRRRRGAAEIASHKSYTVPSGRVTPLSPSFLPIPSLLLDSCEQDVYINARPSPFLVDTPMSRRTEPCLASLPSFLRSSLPKFLSAARARPGRRASEILTIPECTHSAVCTLRPHYPLRNTHSPPLATSLARSFAHT